MASSSTVRLTLGQWPEYYRSPITQDATDAVSKFLQKNHDEHHIFFNDEGFHNHIVHHLLTIWALGANSKDIENAYNTNKSYQRPPRPINKAIVDGMHQPDVFSKYLGNEKHYHDYLIYFQEEINRSSWQEVTNRYLLADDDRANDMLARLFGGFLHPLIHLGFGVEFHQPAIIAEALAQAAVHDAWMGKYLFPAEEAASKMADQPDKTIVQLIDDIHADEKLRDAPKWSDGNKVRDGIIGRAADRMLEYAAQFNVRANTLERQTAEMINAVAYYTAGAQRPDKMHKIDFYYMHCVNCSIFYSAFHKQDWISDAHKARLLEWKVRTDLAMYASRKSPDIRMEDIRDYKPKMASGWAGIEDRVVKFDDDGHASKLIRALAHGQQICQPYEDRDEFRLKHDDWLQIGHMVIDSVEGAKQNWVRSAGFEEAWIDIPPRAQL